MSAFLYGVILQWKLDLRNKGVILTYYVVPLLFFAFMGAIFTSINPTAKDSLIQSMTIFGTTMGAFLGTPTPLVELYGSDIVKAYKVGGIPVWMAAVNNFISAFFHLFIMSIIIYLLAPMAFAAKVPQSTLYFFLSLAFFIVVCLAIGSVLGLFIKDISKLTMFSQLIFLPSLMLSGIMFPVDLLPIVLQNVGKVFPATWALMILGANEFDFTLFLPLLFILCLAVFASVYKLSRVGIE
ncbi:MAG TPA: ABC transporter permease [Oscillospiraceae bacterium]|nr:ABC transporter permease [Oscillospiraceae bacterium]